MVAKIVAYVLCLRQGSQGLGRLMVYMGLSQPSLDIDHHRDSLALVSDLTPRVLIPSKFPDAIGLWETSWRPSELPCAPFSSEPLNLQSILSPLEILLDLIIMGSDTVHWRGAGDTN